MNSLKLPLAALLLAACATLGDDFRATQATWQGASYDAVLARWGEPASYAILSDGAYVYTWQSETIVQRGRIYPSVGVFGGSRGISVGGGVTMGAGGGAQQRCERTLVFREARVAEQTWHGDSAFCETFRR